MNNSNSRDVQDLIAEFVTSKNQLLHEEIISSIKKESFSNSQDVDIDQNEASPFVPTTDIPVPADAIELLQQKIEALTARNRELQEELTISQMRESQIIASAKPISTDDLRMEFLNFTSAHIQQFNTRIKKTEELIESQIQKNQQPTEKNSRRDFPIWLFWTNIAILGLIAVYFVLSLFSSNDNKNVSKIGVETTQSAAMTNAESEKTNEKELASGKVKNEVVEEKFVPEIPPATTTFSATASNAESASTPFRKTTIATSTPPDVKAAAIPQHVVKTPVINEMPVKNTGTVTNNISAAKSRDASKEKIIPVAKPVAKVVNKTPQIQTSAAKTQRENKASASAIQTTTKQQVPTDNPKPKTEKKSAAKEKVYFGED